MLLARLNNEEFETELPMPVFDTVDPAPAIKDLKKCYYSPSYIWWYGSIRKP